MTNPQSYSGWQTWHNMLLVKLTQAKAMAELIGDEQSAAALFDMWADVSSRQNPYPYDGFNAVADADAHYAQQIDDLIAQLEE